VGGVAGSLHYSNADAGVTARVGGIYWRLEESIKRQESRVGSIMGADGSIFAMRRALYPEVPPQLLDDMIASLAVTFAGFRLIHSSRVIAYEKSATSAGDEFRRKRRIACRAFHTHRFLWPRLASTYGALDIYKYVSHKLLRWLGLVPLVLTMAFLFSGLALAGQWRALAMLILGLMLGLAAGWADLPLFRAGYQVLAAITATFLGVVDALRGRTMQTWTPAASRD
jgi:cellulose synthase/poly-beta-1,6-N-acetylglucosamine synthase-like glycosyltransferase